MTWHVYIVECGDGSLYTGITTDLSRRVDEHNGGARGARYTRARGPVRLLYAAAAENRSEASRQEWAIKQLTRREKLALITSAPTIEHPEL